MNEQVRDEHRERLLELLEKGNHVVYTVLRHVSRSGMSRCIDLYTLVDNELCCLSALVASVCDRKTDRKYSGIKVGGRGRDMGFHLVYTLSIALYCPKEFDHDAAHKLTHRWL